MVPTNDAIIGSGDGWQTGKLQLHYYLLRNRPYMPLIISSSLWTRTGHMTS